MKRINVVALCRDRTIDEKIRRHRDGDTGARFSQGKYLKIGGGVIGCITTMATKDNLCAEIYEMT